jgi:hypothetical protein
VSVIHGQTAGQSMKQLVYEYFNDLNLIFSVLFITSGSITAWTFSAAKRDVR